MTAIIGWAHSKFGKLEAETLESLIAGIAAQAIADAGIKPGEIDVIYVGNFGGFEKQSFPAAFALKASSDLRFKPATRVENACATGSAAVPFMSTGTVKMVDRWFPGPLSHPYPSVSNCHTDAALAGHGTDDTRRPGQPSVVGCGGQRLSHRPRLCAASSSA